MRRITPFTAASGVIGTLLLAVLASIAVIALPGIAVLLAVTFVYCMLTSRTLSECRNGFADLAGWIIDARRFPRMICRLWMEEA